MFQVAVQQNSKSTFNLLTSIKKYNGETSGGYSTAILLNDQKTFLTCAHVFNIYQKVFLRDQKALTENNTKIKEVEEKNVDEKIKRRLKDKIIFDPNLLTNISFYIPHFSGNIDLNSVKLDWSKDIAIFKLKEEINLLDDQYFPVFNKTNQYNPGTSVCRLGYPFNSVNVTWKDEGGFLFDTHSSQLQFPNEGIISRIIDLNAIIDETTRTGEIIETTSAGLKGQSGGPIFDTNSVIQAMQSYTSTLPLNITGSVMIKNKTFDEHQFMSLGNGISSKEICRFLDFNSIPYNFV